MAKSEHERISDLEVLTKKLEDEFSSLSQSVVVRPALTDRRLESQTTPHVVHNHNYFLSSRQEFAGFVSNYPESFKFTKESSTRVNDLHVEFDVDGVRVKDKGGFKSATPNGTTYDFKKGTATDITSEVIEFEADVKFNIVKWWWTTDNVQDPDDNGGQPHEGPPADHT